MKGLWKYISPFAPDQSGAAAVMYGLNGIVVICDAGGCAGNICGFDEPRWFSGGKSAVFSAGLRDMDAILGRDDRLVAKLADAARQIDASFAAIVGTPVPSVIGTDYRALKRMMPDNYPYTVRVVSDILESNGSSSMATVCAGTLALMDAGIPIKKPVTGIAMGLITDKGCEKYAVLSDILGDEDHLGDMDFKVTGTEDGITATQMDIKVDGLPYEILEKALEQARRGRLHIMNIIKQTLPAPRPDLKPHAPRMVTMTVDKDQIGAIIGPGGKIIQDIQDKSGTVIVIEEVDNKGIVDISAANAESIAIAVARIKAIVAKPEVGEVYEGTVKNLAAFGAFVEFLPGKDGLLHVSELDNKRVENVEDVLKEGDKIKVKLIGIDPKTGKYKLSHKALLPKPEGREDNGERRRDSRGPRPERGDRPARGPRPERRDK